MAQGGTRWHTGGTPPRIRTIPKGEDLESVPVCRVAQVAHLFDKLSFCTHTCVTCYTDTLTHPLYNFLIRKKKS